MIVHDSDSRSFQAFLCKTDKTQGWKKTQGFDKTQGILTKIRVFFGPKFSSVGQNPYFFSQKWYANLQKTQGQIPENSEFGIYPNSFKFCRSAQKILH